MRLGESGTGTTYHTKSLINDRLTNKQTDSNIKHPSSLD